ncbi:NAD(P)-binding protein [Amylocarpus encephaloides]|uniref:NAD(P)-binding protein n=1 Tax=Amylocarpus encephaloides TaxID=45428 RepID=A0A9P7YBC2_9HELO|nr:NAD(P)-binding protein [Amylocarpus encephaloides]
MASKDEVQYLEPGWKEQKEKLPYPEQDCTGKTIVVVGANVGLGKDAVQHFARLGASKVIMAVRSRSRGEQARRDIEAALNLNGGILVVWELDLACHSSVQAFAERLSTQSRVDAVVMNASIAVMKFELVEDNESTITINVINTYLLVLLLLPILKQYASKWDIRPTITVVGSGIHGMVKFPEWDEPNVLAYMNDPKTAKMDDRYAASKLLQIFAMHEVAAMMSEKDYPITLNSVNPGLCKTSLARNATGIFHIQMVILKFLYAYTSEEGSRTLVHAATCGPESHGRFFTNCDPQRVYTSSFVRSEDGQKAQKKIWKEILEKLEKIQPGISANL